ncbi:MAG: acyltransferase [Planctomycetaceae bacterium]|nr:acyltransferase [Planctomycetaceae bacterium]
MIRALAAWLVVFHHYVQIVHNFACPSWIGQFFGRNGNFGVQLFFVLSGVVMTIAIKSRPPVSCLRDAGKFLTRRLRRIIPAYWVATILFLAFIWQLKPATFSVAPNWGGHVLASGLFIPLPNFFCNASHPLLTVGWTLNFEMTFYVFISASLIFQLFFPQKLWVPLTILCLLLLPRLREFAGPWHNVVGKPIFYTFPIGVATGYGISRVQSQLAGKRKLILGFSLLAFAVVLGCVDRNTVSKLPFRFYLGEGDFLLAALIIGGLATLDELLTRLPGIALFRRLGDISYSTYLYHVFAIVGVVEVFGHPSSLWGDIGCLTLVIGITLALSEASFRFVEQPWLSRRSGSDAHTAKVPTSLA